MISNEVDLTADFRFSRTMPTTLMSTFWHDNSGYIPSLEFTKRSKFLPWNVKKIAQVEDGRRVYSEDDPVSNELGILTRMTYDNDLMFIDQRFSDYRVVEETVMECLGKFPYSAINICYRCGKKTIAPTKRQFMFELCEKCATERGRIPWR